MWSRLLGYCVLDITYKQVSAEMCKYLIQYRSLEFKFISATTLKSNSFTLSNAQWKQDLREHICWLWVSLSAFLGLINDQRLLTNMPQIRLHDNVLMM